MKRVVNGMDPTQDGACPNFAKTGRYMIPPSRITKKSRGRFPKAVHLPVPDSAVGNRRRSLNTPVFVPSTALL